MGCCLFFCLRRIFRGSEGPRKIDTQHEMLSGLNQRRRVPTTRHRRSKAATLPAVVFWAIVSLLCLTTLCLISYQVSSAAEHPENPPTASTLLDIGFMPSHTTVQCTISTPHSTNPNKSDVARGKFHITVRSDLAPKASEAFLHLVRTNYYSGTYFHRVVKNFVAQVGINNNYNAMRPPGPKDTVPDPVLPTSLTNVRGTVSFAGGNMRLGQIFINLGNNQRLDGENGGDGSTRPFGMVSQANEDDMKLIDKIYSGYKEGSGQVKAVKNGEVATQFPNMSRIEECHVVEQMGII